MANKGKILSEETVYQAKYFSIKKKTIERKGRTFTKDFIQRNPTVFILPINEKGEIYLEMQYRDAFDKTILEVVAGNMEKEADPLETAKRELLEETGLTAASWEQIASWELSVNMNSPVYIFIAEGLIEGESTPDVDEDITLVKMPFEEAVLKAIDGQFISSVHVAAILLYDKLKQVKN